MSLTDRWLLPDGIDEVLPPAAARIEALRRQVLDLLAGWGYELVMPPLIEYLDSLLTGLGEDLELQTFKLTDQMSGRLLGVRADMTPQVARIDAHRLQREVPVRLCYLGTVLHTRQSGFDGSRNPLQLGAELYGHAGIESDAEVLAVLVEILRMVGAGRVVVSLGHAGVFRALVAAADLDAGRRDELLALLNRKAAADVAAALAGWGVQEPARGMLAALVELDGDATVLGQARSRFAPAGAAALAPLADLQRLSALLHARAPDVELHFDLAEMRGYNYHTGVMFEAFVPGVGRAVASGGRYDDVGRVFGRARPATGFSADLKVLARLAPAAGAGRGAIYAPAAGADDADLIAEISRLRAAGERVISGLPGAEAPASALGCDRQLSRRDGRWAVVGL